LIRISTVVCAVDWGSSLHRERPNLVTLDRSKQRLQTKSGVFRGSIGTHKELLPNAAAKYLQQCGTRNPGAQAATERIGAGGHPFHVEMWSAVQRGKGAYHHDHVHEGALVSDVYYAAVPDGSAPLVLRRPADHLFVEDDDDDDMILQPSEGHLVIIPPWLLHGVPLQVPTNESGLPRVSFAFNVNGAYAWSDPWDVTRDGNPTGVV
jgi:hypothetical protein